MQKITNSEGLIVYPVNPVEELVPNMHETLCKYGVKFIRKTESEIVLFNLSKYGPVVANKTKQSALSEVKKTLLKKFQNHFQKDLKWTLKVDFRWVEQNQHEHGHSKGPLVKAESIIVRCEVHGLNGLYNNINEEFGTALPYPSPYLTLYTLENKLTVRVDTEDELRHHTKDVPSVRIAEIRKEILQLK